MARIPHMDNQLYKDLKECDARGCWPLVKDIVTTQLIGEDVIPIPYLIDAMHYDHGSVVVKEALTAMEKLKRKKPGIITIGTINDFIKEERKTGLLHNEPKTKKVASELNPIYAFEETALKHKLRKTVKVEISDCQRYVMENIPTEDSLTVNLEDKGFVNLKKIYLIYEVYYAQRIVVTVTIGNEVDRVEIKQEVPVAFRMRRFKLKDDGALGHGKDIQNKKSFEWIKRSHFRNPMETPENKRNPNDPLPAVPKA